MALGLTSAVVAAVVASATLLPLPQSSPLRQVPALALPTVPAEPTAGSVSTPTTGPRTPTTAPSRSTPTLDSGLQAVSRATSAPEPASAQAPATAGTTTSSEELSTVGATGTQPLVTGPTTTAAPTTTAPTTMAAPTTTTLATTTSTEPTTSSVEPTTTTVLAIP